MSENDIYKKMSSAIESVMIPLRRGEPLIPSKLEELKSFLVKMRAEAVSSDGLIRADVAMQLVSIYPAMLGIASGHKEAVLIEDWAIDLQDAILYLLLG